MCRKLLVASIILSLMAGAAQAQVTLDSLQRRAYAHCEPTGQPVERQELQSSQVGPFDVDYVIDAGDIHVRSVHHSTLVVVDGELLLEGSFLGEIVDAGSGFTGVSMAAASVYASFTAAAEMFASLDLEAVDGLAYFLDYTSGEYLFYLVEPGSHSLESPLVAGHTYQFWFQHEVGHFGGGPATRLKEASFSLIVSHSPVPEDETSWGGVKALFR